MGISVGPVSTFSSLFSRNLKGHFAWNLQAWTCLPKPGRVSLQNSTEAGPSRRTLSYDNRWEGFRLSWWRLTTLSPSQGTSPTLLRIFPLIQPLFPLGNDYFHQNNIDLHVEIINCLQAILRHWSRELIKTLSRPSVFMLEFSGQLTTPDRLSYHTGSGTPIGTPFGPGPYFSNLQ